MPNSMMVCRNVVWTQNRVVLGARSDSCSQNPEQALPLTSLCPEASLSFQVPASLRWAGSQQVLGCSLEREQASPWNWAETIPLFSVINFGNFGSMLSAREHLFKSKSSILLILIWKKSFLFGMGGKLTLFLNVCLFQIELKRNSVEKDFYVCSYFNLLVKVPLKRYV